MNKILKLTPEEFTILKKAKNYQKLPSTIKTLFEQHEILIEETAIVIKDVVDEETDIWYLLDNQETPIQVFFMTILEIEEEGEITEEEENKVELILLKITCETPTVSLNAYDYPIFRLGLPLTKQTHISGEGREQLKEEKQKDKWDYFFQPSRERLTCQHNFLIRRFEENSKVYYNRGGLFMNIVYFSIASSFLLLDFYSFVFSFIIFLAACLSIWRLSRNMGYKNFFHDVAQIIEEEKNDLESQINWIPPSISQMEDWLEEEIVAIDAKVIKELKFSKDKIIKRAWNNTDEVRFVGKEIYGLEIQEYGFTQPLETNGKEWIEKNYPQHLQAYTYRPNSPLVGVYYIHLIYMTPDRIGYSRFFYDFILARREGDITKEYYYIDIISIGTKVTTTKVFSNLEEWKTKILKFSLRNPEVIEVGLTDKIAIENIRRMADAWKDTEELPADLLESDTPDLDRLLETPADELPGTKVRFIEDTVKTYWNERKEIKKPKKY